MNTCVIGGGPAGMMAAIIAAQNGQNVTLYEQNDKLGKKLFLTGKGRCNLTNSCDVEELFQNVVTNSKFLYSSFYGFSNSDTIRFFEDAGLKLKIERGMRVFPQSDHSSDVIKVLTQLLKQYNVNIQLNTKAVKLLTKTDETVGLAVYGLSLYDASKASSYDMYYDRIIMATGGKSYTVTGSDGVFFPYLETLGICVKPLKPALSALRSNDSDITNLQGLSLKNVTFTLEVSKKVRYKQMGEMLFTHFGISGPLVLSASSYLKSTDFVETKEDDLSELKENIVGYIDLKPALSFDVLDARLLRDFSENENKDIINVMGLLVPGKMCEVILKKAGIEPHKKIHDITKNQRTSIAECLKKFPVTVNGVAPMNEAIITSGGVSVKDINPSTMECKKVKNLFLAGEMIDVDALTGGFNLQIAWSTGYLAGSYSQG